MCLLNMPECFVRFHTISKMSLQAPSILHIAISQTRRLRPGLTRDPAGTTHRLKHYSARRVVSFISFTGIRNSRQKTK